MQNINIQPLKKVVQPQLTELLKNTFTPEITLSIARGMGYQAKILEDIQETEKQEITEVNEEGQEVIKIIDVLVYKTVEKDNPISPREFVADNFIDILFRQTITAINTDYKNNIIPAQISELIKPFEAEAKNVE